MISSTVPGVKDFSDGGASNQDQTSHKGLPFSGNCDIFMQRIQTLVVRSVYK